MYLDAILNPLNEAQRAAVSAQLVPVLVLAGAGSGKTRVLTHRIAWLIQAEHASPYSILAVTFTNKAAAEMRGRVEQILGTPPGVLWIGTFHGVAHRLLRLHWREAGLAQGFQILDSDDQQRLVKRIIKANDLDEARWEPREVQWFINSNKDEGRRPKDLKAGNDPTRAQMIRLYGLYEEACARAGVVDFAELLLRAYELWRDHPELLAHYRQRFRHVLVDEFQDTNAIQYSWIKLLVGSEGHPFVVGDDDQCLAAGTLVTMSDGSLKAIEAVAAGERILSSYGSGDFRAALVTEKFTARRQGRMVCLHLRSGQKVRSTPEHTHFAGYLLGETPQTYFMYLMHKRGVGYRVGTSQVYPKGQTRPVVGFKQRALQEHADAAWIIRTHMNENDARLDEMLTSLRYGLPTLPFVPRKGKTRNGLVHDPEYIERVFRSIDTESAAQRLLEESGLDSQRPHHCPRSRNSCRRNIVITLCGDHRGANPMHCISIIGVDGADRAALEELGLTVRSAKNGSRSWRFETVRRDFVELMALARQIRDKLGARYVLQGRILDRSLPFVRAIDVRPGMVLATPSGRFDAVEHVEHEDLDIEVHDLNVAQTHNYIANGIVTHNSIYGWRGARIGNVRDFQRDFPRRKIFRLEQNYRSTAAILAAANALIANNSGRLGKTLWTNGEPGLPLQLYAAFNERDEAEFVARRVADYVASGNRRSDIAVLYRSNSQSRAFEEAFIAGRIPYKVYGGLRFFERAEIKDSLAYLRLLLNRDDDAAYERVVNLPTRGIGDRTIESLRDEARAAGISLWKAAGARSEAQQGGRTASALRAFHDLIDRLAQETAGLALHEQIDHVLKESGLIEHHGREKSGQDSARAEARGELARNEARVENLAELVSAARSFAAESTDGELPPLESFLAHAALESGERESDAGQDSVQMMTLHMAKGLEFMYVFLCGMEEGLFPHNRCMSDLEALEEERRLCYVGMTRAMKHLYLTYAEQRRLHGMDTHPAPSRFIKEVPQDIVAEVRPRLQAARATATRARREQPAAPVIRFRTEAPPPPGMRLGARVRHGKFGEGVVLNVEGSGPHARVQVNFEQQGTKWLMMQYANLEAL
ncbi:MAG TPA: UvrD-helicase domain-containing protein [Steroidobacteraceae bacterium]|jgi:DNA helicase-2/ATP-dependent DNA helicase PcrA